MPNRLSDTLSAAAAAVRDRALAELAEFFANRSPLARYGRVSAVSFDSRAKRLRFDLLLRGEASPIEIRARYRRERTGSASFLVIEEAATSREWADLLFRDLAALHPPRIELPPKIALAARVLGV